MANKNIIGGNKPSNVNVLGFNLTKYFAKLLVYGSSFGFALLNMITKEIKIDFHTHSILSHDGGLSMDQYKQVLANKLLDYVAITDHNEIDFALEAKEELGERIIIGEEIMTSMGEIIGLYIKEKIKQNQDPTTTIEQIKEQGGLVYLPHPFDVKRSSLKKEFIQKHKKDIDIVEVFNSRSIIPKTNEKGERYFLSSKIAKVAGSDAHSYDEIGRTYNLLDDFPTRENILELLKESDYLIKYVSFISIFSPKVNTLRKKLNVRR